MITVIKSGNRDERCHKYGHDWEAGKPYYWDIRHGWFERCSICDMQIVTKEE